DRGVAMLPSYSMSWNARRVYALLFLSALLALIPARAQDNGVTRDIDPELRRLIDTTPAFDNHAHPVLAPPADASDRNFDALPVDNMAPQTDPVAWRADNPQ